MFAVVRHKKTSEYAITQMRLTGHRKGISLGDLNKEHWKYYAHGLDDQIKEAVIEAYHASDEAGPRSSASSIGKRQRSPEAEEDEEDQSWGKWNAEDKINDNPQG